MNEISLKTLYNWLSQYESKLNGELITSATIECGIVVCSSIIKPKKAIVNTDGTISIYDVYDKYLIELFELNPVDACEISRESIDMITLETWLQTYGWSIFDKSNNHLIGNNLTISQYYSERFDAVKFIFNNGQETKKVQYAVVNADGVVTIRTSMKEEYLIKFHKTVDIDPRVD